MDEMPATPVDSTHRTYGVAMLLGAVAVFVMSVTFFVGAAGWWSYATGGIALAGALVLGGFGIRAVSSGTRVSSEDR